MLCLQAAQTACAADASSCPFRCTTISAPCSSGHSLTPEARQQWRLALQVPSDCRLRKNCSDRVDRSRDRLCAAPPLNLSAQRHSQRQHEPQTETEGGGGHCGRGWAGAPPFGGGSSGWRRSNDDDGDEDVDAHALDPFRRTVVGLQTRMQTEPHFVMRLLALALLDVGAVFLVNRAARGERFAHELDAVIGQAVVSALNTMVLGLLLPPQHTQVIRLFVLQDGGLRSGLSLPAHIFARSPTPSAFGLPQRLASLMAFGAEFGAVGFVCGVVGSEAIKWMSSSAATTALPRQQSAAELGGKWLLFMAVHGNIRHQLLRCCQRTLLPLAPNGAVEACVDAVLHAASHVVGAWQWLAYTD